MYSSEHDGPNKYNKKTQKNIGFNTEEVYQPNSAIPYVLFIIFMFGMIYFSS